MRQSLKVSLILSIWLLVGQSQFSETRAAVRLSVDSTSIHFGDVLLPGYRDVVITLTDTSDADVQIEKIEAVAAASSDYAILDPVSYPVIIPANGTLQVIVRFSPSTTGVRTSLLQVHTTEGDLSLLMNGTGVT